MFLVISFIQQIFSPLNKFSQEFSQVFSTKSFSIVSFSQTKNFGNVSFISFIFFLILLNKNFVLHREQNFSSFKYSKLFNIFGSLKIFSKISFLLKSSRSLESNSKALLQQLFVLSKAFSMSLKHKDAFSQNNSFH